MDDRRHRRAARALPRRHRREVPRTCPPGGRAVLWQGRGRDGARGRRRACGWHKPGRRSRPWSGCRLRPAASAAHVIPTIRIVAGKLPEIVEEIAPRADRQRCTGLRPRRHAGRTGLRNHRCGRRTQDRHRAVAPFVGRFPAVADRRCRNLPELQPQAQRLGRCRSAVAARAHGAGRRAAMGLSACERDHHHPDPARRRVAARGTRLRPAVRDSICCRPCSCRPSPSIRPKSRPGPRSTC